jgi:ribonucleoside-diphosphate reductase alpha chain
LKFVLDFCRAKILSRQGTFIRTIDAHDMFCVVGGAAVSGGVRRTAMISIFDWDDTLMLACKDGTELDANPWRWNANNSAVWPEEIAQEDLVRQFLTMYSSRRGEPGIFSRANAIRTKPERRKAHRFGPNPCGEINLPEYGLCNLSIAVARREDTLVSLARKVRLAAIIGTIQGLATTFPGMRPEWKANCEDERLLGVDITGQQDCPVVQNAEVLSRLKGLAIDTNRWCADALGINRSAAITCNKPSGNSSTLLNCSSGIHARWAPYYVRNVRVSPHTPIYHVLRAAGVPMDPENGQNERNATSWVVHFPVESPHGAITRKGRSAIEQCEYWLLNKLNWTEHNPSVTITYQPEELIALMDWVWEHRNQIGGMAFLPADDAQYLQMPYEEISQERYEELMVCSPPLTSPCSRSTRRETRLMQRRRWPACRGAVTSDACTSSC